MLCQLSAWSPIYVENLMYNKKKKHTYNSMTIMPLQSKKMPAVKNTAQI